MEKYNETNPLENWISTDNKLSQMLSEIETVSNSEQEQAKIAFHRLAENYNLPKYPDDVQDRETIQVADFHLYNPISIYEVLGKIKFVDKNLQNLKSNVLLAAYLIINNLEPFIDEELDEFLGNNQLSGFGYKGEDVDVEMIPIIEGESWFEKGCTFFTKEI
ncbi:MAG TPA: hypothetical protein VK164_02905 [Flavobacterium sp.]|uniref:hypothetical protein n=1 Tax=Flavobacterium sp. TaxID=239 RepID=UPI002B4B1AFC|nr:hypothetical protein [Flavobacterium sp.]HLO72860.1 hypothetical protein [Flavobacterium sp.]